VQHVVLGHFHNERLTVPVSLELERSLDAMPSLSEYFRSVADVWIVWIVGMALLLFITWRLCRGAKRRGFRMLARDERGASYTLSLALVIPFYVLLVGTVVECTLILLVKMGTTYAAYASARSAAVWMSAEPPRPDKVQAAAVAAITPFSSSLQQHVIGGEADAASAEEGAAFTDAFQEYSGKNRNPAYFLNKYRYARRATTTEIDASSDEFNAELTITVRYEMPFHLPGIGRFLGERASFPGASFYVRKIESSATIPKEGPRSDNQTLGIRYDSAQ
jgi:hypothetical protein